MKTTTIRLFLAFLCLSATRFNAQAVNPPPDGGYPNFTTAEGDNALKALTTGVGNTAVGTFSLFSVSAGNFNTAVGAGSLDLNQADSNTATGAAALLFNTTGADNAAVGTAALEFNDTGSNNTANGAFALFNNTTGDGNTAVGTNALLSNTIGVQNTAFGLNALASNTTAGANGSGANTGIGAFALFNNTIGGANTAIGYATLGNSTGGNNIAIGDVAGFELTMGNDNIDIGNRGVAGESGTIRIGTLGTQTATFIAGISGATASGGVAVFVNTDGQLGTLTSSARFKDDIEPMDKASEAVLALKPVTFRYKKEIDPQGIPQFGLVAEEVEKVNTDLVVRDRQGQVYSVRYEAVNAMLLNEFLKEHHEVQELKKQVAALTAGLQKVSAQLQASKPAPQLVNNP